MVEFIKGVTKKILTPGEAGDCPVQGQEVLVNYEVRLQDGTIFDSSYDRQTLKVIIGVGQVIKGLGCRNHMHVTRGEGRAYN